MTSGSTGHSDKLISFTKHKMRKEDIQPGTRSRGTIGGEFLMFPCDHLTLKF